MEETVMTVKEVSGYLQIHPMTVYRLTKEGRLPFFRIGSAIRFKKSQLDKLFDKQRSVKCQS